MNRIPLSEPKLMEFLDMINASIKKFSMLIKDIGTIAKIEAEMITMEMVDLDEIINNVEWSLANKIESTGAVITRELEVKHILFSKKNFRSILYNLVSNAVKFKRDENPLIHIHCVKEGEHIILTVRDNGMGIPKVRLNKIFEMYGRLHQDIEGHGIGLYLAKKIVDAAGGNIIVESEPGKGSKFIIYLKASPALHPVTDVSLN